MINNHKSTKGNNRSKGEMIRGKWGEERFLTTTYYYQSLLTTHDTNKAKISLFQNVLSLVLSDMPDNLQQISFPALKYLFTYTLPNIARVIERLPLVPLITLFLSLCFPTTILILVLTSFHFMSFFFSFTYCTICYHVSLVNITNS